MLKSTWGRLQSLNLTVHPIQRTKWKRKRWRFGRRRLDARMLFSSLSISISEIYSGPKSELSLFLFLSIYIRIVFFYTTDWLLSFFLWTISLLKKSFRCVLHSRTKKREKEKGVSSSVWTTRSWSHSYIVLRKLLLTSLFHPSTEACIYISKHCLMSPWPFQRCSLPSFSMRIPSSSPPKVTKHSLSYRAIPIGIAAKQMSYISSKNLLGFFLVKKVQDHTPLQNPRWPVLFVPLHPSPIRMEHTFAIQNLTHHRQQSFRSYSLFLYNTSLFVYI